MADGMEVQSDVALSDECGSLREEDSNGGPVVVNTPLAQCDRGKVIDRGVHIYKVTKKPFTSK